MLRLFGLASPILNRLDPVLGYEPMPSQVSSRLGVEVQINDAGLRDDEDLAALLGAGDRILVVGNSVTYGSSLVSQDELFTEVAERELRSGHPGIKVLNGGVPGYSVTQIVRRAPRLIARTKPRYLVLYFIRNDFHRPPIRFPPEDSPQHPQRPPPLALVVFTYLSVAFVDSRYRISQRLPVLNAILPRGPRSTVPPYDTSRVLDLHVEAIEQFLRTVWDTGGRRRSDVIAFISPTRRDVEDDRRAPNRDLVLRLEALAIQAHDLQADFHGLLAGHDLGEYYHDEIHYRAAGNAVAGRVLAGYLRSELGATTTERVLRGGAIPLLAIPAGPM